MLELAVITLFPDMFRAVTEFGVTGRACEKGLLSLSIYNPRDYAPGPHRNVDDRPYGGGPGMVMMVEPVRKAIQDARAELSGAKVVYLSPQGRALDQAGVEELSGRQRLILVAGRYEGLDERLIETEVDEEWSIGDYVVSGGELPAMVLIDAMARMVPGVLGHDESANEDSFVNGILDYPHYTRPEVLDGLGVPQVLLSGDHGAIRRWRLKQALGRTWQRRPDLLERLELNEEQSRLLREFQEDLNIKQVL